MIHDTNRLSCTRGRKFSKIKETTVAQLEMSLLSSLRPNLSLTLQLQVLFICKIEIVCVYNN